MEICGSSGPPIVMVPCVHQINVYIKRKLRVWGIQKCNFLVGAKTVPTSLGLQTTSCHAESYGPRMESCGISGLPIAMVPCLHQINVHIKWKLRVWGTQKCNFLVGAKNRTYRYGPANYLVSSNLIQRQQWKFAEFRVHLSPWYRVCTKSMFYQKEGTAVGNPKM